MTTVKQLKEIAKAMNIAGYSKMKKDELIRNIEQREAANEVSRNNNVIHNDEDDILNNNVDDNNKSNDDGFFTPSAGDVVTVQQVQQAANEMSRPTTKTIEYVKGDNTQVCFYAKGKKVRIYLDDNNKLIIHSERRGRRTTNYQGLIQMFRPFTNGVDGDIKLVVSNIVRIKNLMVIRQQKLVADARKAPAHATEEKAQPTKRTQGTVDPQWMQQYAEWFLETQGRRPSGIDIREAWHVEQEQRRA